MKFLLHAAVIVIGILSVPAAFAAGLYGSKHDMTAIPTQVGATPGSSSICVYCHTPHTLLVDDIAPVWNKPPVSSYYVPYSSSTIDGSVSPTMGATTSLCLGCHDGSIAVNVMVNPPLSGGYVTGFSAAPPGWNLTEKGYMTGSPRMDHDFSNDHPVSVSYPASDQGLVHPPPVTFPLYGVLSNKVECTTCHNVHDNLYQPFLRASNDGSTLCRACHNR